MTYFQFHLVFILPLIGLLAWRTRAALLRGERLVGNLSGSTRFGFLALFIHVLIAVAYTTPWDNYLVYREVWGYPPGRVLFTIGYVPFEEYLFFIFQAVLTGLWLYWLARKLNAPAATLNSGVAKLARWGSFGLSLLLAAVGLVALSFEAGTYLGLILVWAGPVWMLQTGFGGDWLLARWRLVTLGVMVPTVYLWLADRVAIGLNIWWISENFTVGFKPFGLPVEEALFFFVTNTFMVFGLTLALHPQALARTGEMFKVLKTQSWWKLALGVWALSMIPTPLFPAAFVLLSYVSTSLLVLGTLGYALERYGFKALALFATAFGFGVAVEWLGKTTGIPFGTYDYTAPGPAVFGVPLLVPLGWWAFTLIALSVTPPRFKLWLAPLALVAWDVGLDPLMVREGFWQFGNPGFYYGVPLSNFIGWYVSGVVLVWLLLRLEPRLRFERSAELRTVFVVQAFLIGVGLSFYGLFWAGLLTFAAMLLFVLPGLRWERLRIQKLRLKTQD